MTAGLTYRIPRRAETYADALRRVGVEPVLISPARPRAMKGLDGLLVSGGGDVDPALYGQQQRAEVSDVDRERDDMEADLIRQALAANQPVFGICRGLQVLNVVCGGTLIQHLTANKHSVPLLTGAHIVEAKPGTKLAAIMGLGGKIVNSRHHQAADRIGRGLVVSAIAPDGVVEGLEHPGKRFVVAVQWHPEERLDAGEYDRALFEAFAAAPRG